jgi:thymidylate synthase (FAD)
MRILKSPKVYLIARPQIVEEGLNAFLEEQGLRWPTPIEGVTDSERLVEVAGRCCYMSFGNKSGSKSNAQYLQNLIGFNADGTCKPGPAHGSVCEHPTWSFLIVGAGRGFSHEQVRHRTGWAYSQLSTRYCDFEREEEEGTWEPGFCIPPLAQLSNVASEAFDNKLRQSQQAYCELLQLIETDLQNNLKFMETLALFEEREKKRMLRKAARGAARDILPIATEAIMVMSANARAVWNCIVLRGSEHAEAAIRDIYVQIAKIMELEMPSLFRGIKYEECWDGTQVVVMPRDKL